MFRCGIKRVFHPVKQPSGWNTLYAEFENTFESDLVNQHVRNLQPGKILCIYVPHSLYPRFRAVNEIAHSYRTGPVPHQTKVRYGISDFILLAKPKHQKNCPWSYVPLDSLPPLQLSPFESPSLSSSPPQGRSRLPSKRSRTSSSEMNSDRVSKSRKPDTINDVTANNNLDVDFPNNDHVPSSLPHNIDIGAFQPSAVVSPKSVSNKDFTFNLNKSKLPKMNNLNC